MRRILFAAAAGLMALLLLAGCQSTKPESSGNAENGSAQVVAEAKQDFLAVFDAMRADYKERTGEDVDATFTFVKDMSAVLQECKNYISFAYLAQITGVSKAMLSQYACGTRKPRPAQRERIVGGIHQIGRTCMEVGVF